MVIPLFYFVGKWLKSSDKEDVTGVKIPRTNSINQLNSATNIQRRDPTASAVEKQNNSIIKMIIGGILFVSFFVLVDPLFSWADLSYEDGWMNIVKAPFAFVFGLAPIVIVLWPILGGALVLEGYKECKRRI